MYRSLASVNEAFYAAPQSYLCFSEIICSSLKSCQELLSLDFISCQRRPVQKYSVTVDWLRVKGAFTVVTF